MKKSGLWLVVSLLATATLSPVFGQEREDRTLLNWDQMHAIINESSGERPLHAVMEMAPYPRVRTREEYQGHFRETQVMAELAREFGFQNVEIESFPSTRGGGWLATQGELWMVSPREEKLYDIYDVAISAISGSESGDVTAELVDVGIGSRPEDYEGKDVKGKIVLGSARAGDLQRLGVFERGAVGVVSYNSLRPDSYPDEIASQRISAGRNGTKTRFGWSIAPRVGRRLAARLGAGEKIKLRSIIKSETFPGEMETVHAVIPGDGSTDQAVAISGHLFENYVKQGANDDKSGCALTLEMGRVFNLLVAEGKLPRPKRDIHFLWVPEISGTMAWLDKHKDIAKKMIGDLNFDMEGLGLRLSSSQWVMHRTPDTTPTFLNDVGANILEVIADLNRERVRFRSQGYGYTLPILSPNGSRDPFYYVIDKHYGASDHVVYMGQGIPSLMFITWPDMFYHSSMDTTDKLDPTQLRRAAVVGTAAMTVLATAGDETAAKVTAESAARGTERMGQSASKGFGYLADASDAASLLESYKEALNTVRHQALVEADVIRSSKVLYDDPAAAEGRLSTLAQTVGRTEDALLAQAKELYQVEAQRLNTTAVEPTPTQAEKEASQLVVEQTGGGGFRGFMRRGSAMQNLSQEEREAIRAAMAKVPQHMTSELGILLGRKMTVMEIRDFLAGEFDPLPLADLMDYLKAMEKLGAVKLAERP